MMDRTKIVTPPLLQLSRSRSNIGRPLSAGIMKVMNPLYYLRAACLLLALGGAARADEGMWLFNDAPKKILKDKYNFDVSAAWLDHLQKASVRFNNGGSGSFVSPNGL